MVTVVFCKTYNSIEKQERTCAHKNLVAPIGQQITRTQVLNVVQKLASKKRIFKADKNLLSIN